MIRLFLIIAFLSSVTVVFAQSDTTITRFRSQVASIESSADLTGLDFSNRLRKKRYKVVVNTASHIAVGRIRYFRNGGKREIWKYERKIGAVPTTLAVATVPVLKILKYDGIATYIRLQHHDKYGLLLREELLIDNKYYTNSGVGIQSKKRSLIVAE